MLDDEEMDRIHRTSLRILGETGVKVAHEGALRLLQGHGARVDLERKRARLPQVMVERVCKLLAEPVEPAVQEDVAREMRRLVQRAQLELAA